MKLTPAQTKLFDRATRRALIHDYKGLDHLTCCDIYGSAEHQTAYRVADLGLGLIVSVQPHNTRFFAVYFDYTVRDDESGETVVIREVSERNAIYTAKREHQFTAPVRIARAPVTLETLAA